MLHHCCFTAEALQASLVGTLVWSLSSMDSSMACKTRRLSLVNTTNELAVSFRWETYIGETLAATNMLTLVRLLTSVRTNVDCQCTALNETLATSGCSTRVRSLVCVYTVMSLQVRLAVEALSFVLVPATTFYTSDKPDQCIPYCMIASRTGKGEPWAHSRPIPSIPSFRIPELHSSGVVPGVCAGGHYLCVSSREGRAADDPSSA